MNLQILPAFDHKDEIRQLFTQYTQMLIDGDPKFADCMEQSFYNAYLGSLNENHLEADKLAQKAAEGKVVCSSLELAQDLPADRLPNRTVTLWCEH